MIIRGVVINIEINMPFTSISFYAIVFFLCLYVQAKPDFEPYKDNSGTVVGIAGKTFCILAADSRLSEQVVYLCI